MGDGGNGEGLLMGSGFILGGDENVLNLIMMMLAKFCEYTENHSIVQLNGYTVCTHCMVCELYLNTAI